MENQKLTKDILDKLRLIEGFPIGKDDDIIKLSDPPFYTICPNPWTTDFIEKYGNPYLEESDDYNSKPFASDISEGKNTPIYNAHSYHTKVPYRAIMNYILHYTNPGDIIFDGFCGTGMTGIASLLCGFDDEIHEINKNNIDNLEEKKGIRYAILNDLSPSASFIAYNYNHSFNVTMFSNKIRKIIAEVKEELGFMYLTKHRNNTTNEKQKNLLNQDVEKNGIIDCVVWSDIFLCPSCQHEINFYNEAINELEGEVNTKFDCPNCNANLNKRNLERVFQTKFDYILNQSVRQAKQIPVLIKYSVEEYQKNKRKNVKHDKKPDENDLKLIEDIENSEIKTWYPSDPFPDGYNTAQPKASHGITHIHHLFTKRNLAILSLIFEKMKTVPSFLFLFQSILVLCSKLTRFNLGNRGNGPVMGTLYVPSIVAETNIFNLLENKLEAFERAFLKIPENHEFIVSCNSSTDLAFINENTIDYIFIDPPFGGNLMYSELNFLWESWLKVFTNNQHEAIINSVQRKGIYEYQFLMERCFKEFNRILKPNRWMTVEFHNSMNSIWNSIQQAIQKTGFIIADVRVLDKKQGTFKQLTTTTAVKSDLIISAYKPKSKFQKYFTQNVENEKSVWEFIREHLEHLPIYVEKNKESEIITERQKYLLFDRMVAFYIQNGFRVPISAGDFYSELHERFPERDGMYFLPNQVSEYDKRILESSGTIQLQLFITDEQSALSWLRNELKNNAQTYQDIQPNFMKQMLSLEKYEKMPELTELLEQNFIKQDDGKWYIPDPSKESDLEKMRFKHLLKEFNAYVVEKKKLKQFRIEAIKAGFKDAWDRKDFDLIINMVEKIPEQVIQEDPILLMYYDNAVMSKPKSS